MPSEIDPQLSENWDQLITRALQASPKKRFESAAEFKNALPSNVSDHPLPASTPAPNLVVPRKSVSTVATPSISSKGHTSGSAQTVTNTPEPEKSRTGIWIAVSILMLGVAGFFAFSQMKKASEPTRIEKRFAESVTTEETIHSEDTAEATENLPISEAAKESDRLFRISKKTRGTTIFQPSLPQLTKRARWQPEPENVSHLW